MIRTMNANDSFFVVTFLIFISQHQRIKVMQMFYWMDRGYMDYVCLIIIQLLKKLETISFIL